MAITGQRASPQSITGPGVGSTQAESVLPLLHPGAAIAIRHSVRSILTRGLHVEFPITLDEWISSLWVS
jgi:hypothetical protein